MSYKPEPRKKFPLKAPKEQINPRKIEGTKRKQPKTNEREN